jgi:hypothetical protein
MGALPAVYIWNYIFVPFDFSSSQFVWFLPWDRLVRTARKALHLADRKREFDSSTTSDNDLRIINDAGAANKLARMSLSCGR